MEMASAAFWRHHGGQVGGQLVCVTPERARICLMHSSHVQWLTRLRDVPCLFLNGSVWLCCYSSNDFPFYLRNGSTYFHIRTLCAIGISLFCDWKESGTQTWVSAGLFLYSVLGCYFVALSRMGSHLPTCCPASIHYNYAGYKGTRPRRG